MAPGRRRGTTAVAPRLTAGLVVGLALLLSLWALVGGEPPEAEAGAPVDDTDVLETDELLAPPAPPTPAAVRDACERDLRALVAAALEDARNRSLGKVTAANTQVAIHAHELGADRRGTLASIDDDRAMTPASNMKLLTTAAALVLLGPDWRFETGFDATGPLRDGVLEGDLVVRAGGDPLLEPGGGDGGRVEPRLAEVATALAGAGLRRVAGALVLDEGSFPDPAPGPAWPSADQHWQEYCALAAGLTANGGVLRASLDPRRKTGVVVHPRPHGLREDYGVAVGGRELDVRIGATETTCTVKGRVPEGREDWTADFRHPDPVELFGTVLEAELEAAGVRIDGGMVRRRGPPGPAAGEGGSGARLATLRSPLADTLIPINTHSRNSVADQVFLATGLAIEGEATRAAGERAVRRALAELSVPTEGFRMVDGSGLSRDNRVSARQLAALIEEVLSRDEHTATLFVDSLAVAGGSGTLEERMVGTQAEGRVFAKSGWIAGRSALSGVARTLEGRLVVFSILIEYPKAEGGMNSGVFKPLQDAIVVRLVEGGA